MNIPYVSNNIALLPGLSTVGQVREASPVLESASASGQVGFSDFLRDAMSATVASDGASKISDVGMLVGDATDLHTVGLTSAKADVMLNLTVQIRNRVIEAYQEVMRMQI